MKTDTNTANTNARPRRGVLASIDNVIDLSAWRKRKNQLCASSKVLPSTHVLLTCGLTA